MLTAQIEAQIQPADGGFVLAVTTSHVGNHYTASTPLSSATLEEARVEAAEKVQALCSIIT